jgi:3-hydroxyisobutyrate dehydrogenase-like beta-hydroxyacid dehydrogenase
MGEVGDATVVKITTNLISASIVKAVIEAAHASWKSLVLRQVPRGKCVLA